MNAESSLACLDVAEAPDAYMLGGRYRVAADGTSVTVTAFLYLGSQQVVTFTVTGTSSALDKLASDIVAAVSSRLAAPGSGTKP